LRVQSGTDNPIQGKSTVMKPPEATEKVMTNSKVVAPVKIILKATYIAEGFTAK
jgi:hypothetical protein